MPDACQIRALALSGLLARTPVAPYLQSLTGSRMLMDRRAAVPCCKHTQPA